MKKTKKNSKFESNILSFVVVVYSVKNILCVCRVSQVCWLVDGWMGGIKPNIKISKFSGSLAPP